MQGEDVMQHFARMMQAHMDIVNYLRDQIAELEKQNKKLKERHFTIEEIKQIMAQAYEHGFIAGQEEKK